MNRAVPGGQSVPKPTLQRLPGYLNYLRGKRREGAEYISASAVAMDMGLNAVQVRKDLAAVSASGRPKTGFPLGMLISDLEAVSYTHLGLLCGLPGYEPRDGCLGGPDGADPLGGDQGAGYRSIPVSYTHLDVYKRQPLWRAAGNGRGFGG